MLTVLTIVLVLVAVYAVLLGALFVAMFQEPEVFNAVMARLPGAVFLVFPFKPLWFVARGGRLRVGDPAPGFSLERQDRSARVRLSELRGVRPVVLVFGSYT